LQKKDNFVEDVRTREITGNKKVFKEKLQMRKYVKEHLRRQDINRSCKKCMNE